MYKLYATNTNKALLSKAVQCSNVLVATALPNRAFIMEEIRKDIIWYEGIYQVSNLWKVKSFKNWSRGLWKTRILKPWYCKKWYAYVQLYNNWPHLHSIHRLVAKVFLPNKQEKPQVNHKDWNPRNNNINNLEWCTVSENVKHWYDVLWRDSTLNGCRGAKNYNSQKIWQYRSDGTVVKIWDTIKDAVEWSLYSENSIRRRCKDGSNKRNNFIWKRI